MVKEHAPAAFKEVSMKNLFGRKVAIDASMCLYQYLIAVRQLDGQQLSSDDGETTSHLLGMFYRTVKIVESGVKPLYVFDGKPPVLKGGELEKRMLKKEEALKQLEELKETGTAEELLKHEKRTVRASREQNAEAQKLLELMGIPYVIAASEAEAQCAELARSGKVYAAASEDMDTICYEPPFLLRHLTVAEAKKMPIDQIEYEEVLKGLDMDKSTFVDLCILLGCDYCETIKGIGPVTAFKLIKEHGSLENIVKWIENNPDKTKYKIPENWPWTEAKELFMNPELINPDEYNIKWNEPDVDGLVEFMVKQKGFNEDRIKNGAEKLKKGLKGGVQGRLDGFFTVVKKTPAKRKEEPKKNTSRKKSKR